MKLIFSPALVQAIRCPLCKSSMELKGAESLQGSTTLVCNGARRHCYDFSSSGYVNLMPPGHANGGDSKPAVRARTEFLNLDLYRPAAEALRDTLLRHATKGILVDAGCGEGYYTSLLAESGFTTAGVDLSRYAVDAAAKRLAKMADPTGFFSVSSVFEMPFADESASVITNVFAPCAEEEFLRILKKDGILAVMYAGPEHLMGLKEALYDQTKENDGRADLPKTMTLLEEVRVRFNITVKGSANLQNLFAMTPYYWKTSPTDSEKLLHLDSLTTPVDMVIAIYQKS